MRAHVYSGGRKLKIAIIAISITGGGRLRAIAYKNFLQSKGHSVDLLIVNEIWSSKICFFYQRALAYLHGKEPRLMEKIADRLESKINTESYDVVIGVESLFSYVLTRKLRCLKIFSWESMIADELYFDHCVKKDSDLDRFYRVREMELEICKQSDYVIFPWTTTENYVRKYIWNGDNFITVKYGCYPQKKTASYFFPVSIVSLGNMKAYWSNKELLSYLTRISPYVIDVYGVYRPPSTYRLNYKGFATSQDILSNYQFGLNTISKDPFRRNHFSSRILSYLAHGLPVLSPDWLKFSHELKGVLPYNEESFLEILEEHSDRERWEKLSKEAREQALELDWNVTLKPLEKMVENR